MSRSIKVTLLLLASFAITGILLLSSRQTVANPPANCGGLPTEGQLKGFLKAAQTTGGTVGGLFEGTRMWGAIVNRDGEICTYTTSTNDPTQVWPGSQGIAKAKAYTGNAFSLDSL